MVTPRTSLRTQVSQLTMANLYLGIAQGAFEAARRYSLEQARAWLNSGVDRSVDDPMCSTATTSAGCSSARPNCWPTRRRTRSCRRWNAARRSPPRDAAKAVAVAVADAKVLAHRASVEVSSQLFELTSAASTSARHGLDRYWRKARVHTQHDPVDYTLRDIGRCRLDGRVPEPTP